MHIIKSVEVFSVAKIASLLYLCFGLILAPFFLLFGLLGSALGQKSPIAGLFGVGFALFMPVFYGIIGFIGGLIWGLLYNLFARWVGGIEVELEVKGVTTVLTPVVAPYPLVPPQNPVA